ncbi:MAG: hypothetical protein HYZ49_20540 [Chloroflexi bacterium]|nr:hypothetical protein [Chloroflexota bacterium]
MQYRFKHSLLLSAIVTAMALIISCASPSILTHFPTSTTTPASTATNTVQLTAVPTSTSQPPTKARTPTSAHPAELPTSTPGFDIDFNLTATAVVGQLVASGSSKIESYFSPDRKWRADFVSYECMHVEGSVDANSYEEMKLVEMSTDIEKVIAHQFIYCGGLGAYGLGGLFWSSNSRYFYYTETREGVPDGCNLFGEKPISRLDATNLQTEGLGAGPLSPDKTKLATWENNGISVWSLDDGKLASFSAVMPGGTGGPIAWSSGSQSLVYLQIDSECPPSGKTRLGLIDLPTMKQKLLVESEEVGFLSVRWEGFARLILSDFQGKEWHYEFATGELKPAQ